VYADSGAPALAGVGRAGVTACAGAAVGAAAGWFAARAMPDGGFAIAVGTGVLAAVVALACVAGALWVSDRDDVRRLLRR
jgi:hypothetical protein